MEPKKRHRPSADTGSKDTVLVRLVAGFLPPDSPEFQERANLPLSERGPNLARYHEEANAASEQPPNDKGPPKHTGLVRLTAKFLPPDSPEFQERAKRPLSERGPNLARYHEEAKAASEQPPNENG